MHVTGVSTVERERYRRQLDRIAGSGALHASQSLCRLLRYLADHALDQPGTALNEYQIATEALGRPADFDPQSDSTVRVQLGRLRAKLAEYYRAEGADDEIIIEIPKGSHTVSFAHRNHPLKPSSHEFYRAESESAQRGSAERRWKFLAIAFGVVLLLALVMLFAVLRSFRAPASAPAAANNAAPDSFRVFWKPFLGTQAPLVIYSNAVFVGRPETGLRYYDPLRDSRTSIFDQYTGIGEVMAVHDLDLVFAQFHRDIVVKRGRLFTLDDAQNNNLIFVGSPSENLTLREIPTTEEFAFERLKTGPRRGDLAIVNLHPNPGEPATFLASPANSPMTEDYAIIAQMPGLNPAYTVMILAGTTTFGTMGAAEYVSEPDSVEKLVLRLALSPQNELQPFEGLLRVTITNGVPIKENIVALRERP